MPTVGKKHYVSGLRRMSSRRRHYFALGRRAHHHTLICYRAAGDFFSGRQSVSRSSGPAEHGEGRLVAGFSNVFPRPSVDKLPDARLDTVQIQSYSPRTRTTAASMFVNWADHHFEPTIGR